MLEKPLKKREALFPTVSHRQQVKASGLESFAFASTAEK